jgi:aldehyde dehydrogenase (NAD+)
MSKANADKFYIEGAWVAPIEPRLLPVINPATEAVIGQVAMGSRADVDRAVKAARAAIPAWSTSSRDNRLALLTRIVDIYKRRFNEMGAAISEEMGAPLGFATKFQAGAGLGHFRTAIDILKTFPFEESMGTTQVVREAIGVAGMITPWNWPANQIACKVAPALAVGCTMILKPSEVAPYSALLLAEILDEAGVPKGVFNLINGDGASVGAPMAAHPGIDVISFTGSTRAGIDVAIKAAPTVKRVAQELGGKSANIILDDADLTKAVTQGVQAVMRNSGQSCNAPTRMLIPAAKMADAAVIARIAAEKLKVGDPNAADTDVGPVVSKAQWDKIQALIATGIKDGATVAVGGSGRPEGLDKGYYVKPTVFTGVDNAMTIAREEIFGPVLVLIPFKDDADAVRIANESDFGLAAYVQSADVERARRVARRLRVGMVHINNAPADGRAPFGGYKQSGNGREWGRFGFDEYLETKAVMGWSVG